MIPANPSPPRLTLSALLFFKALLGANIVSLIPAIPLIYFHAGGKFLGQGPAWDFGALVFLILTAIILCPWFTTALTAILLVCFKGLDLEGQERDRIRLPRFGTLMGAFLGPLNLPAYLGVAHWPKDENLGWVAMILILAVGGVCAGFWTGWQVFRANYPPQSFFPKFSLRTLFVLSFCFGILLWLCSPPGFSPLSAPPSP